MKKYKFISLMACMLPACIVAQNVAITDDGSYTANASAMLDVKSTTKGLLIPRLTVEQKNVLSSPATGLLIFQTNSNPGIYYNAGTPASPSWLPIFSNTLTDADNDTKIQVEESPDEDYIRFAVDGTEVMIIDPEGNIGLGNSMPGQQLDMTGNISLPNTTSTSTGIIYKGGSPFIHNYEESGTDGANTFIGYNAGNFTMAGSGAEASYNLGVGTGTLYRLTTGAYNSATGPYALNFLTSGDNNTAMGAISLYKTNTGDNNTAVGKESGYNNQIGSGNLFLGYQAGYSETGSNKLYVDNSNTSTPLIYGEFDNDTLAIHGDLGILGQIKITGGNPGAGKVLTSDGDGVASWASSGGGGAINDLTDGISDGASVFLGLNAGQNDDGDNNNTGLGISSFYSITSGQSNTAIGYRTMFWNTTGSNNTALGSQAMYTNDNGSNNTFLGTMSGFSNTFGYSNTFIGANSGRGNLSGYNNVIAGYNAGYNNTLGYRNVFIGHASGYNNTTSNHNVFIGDSAGFAQIELAENIFIGTNSGRYNQLGSFNVYIGNRCGYISTHGGYNTFIGHNAGEKNTASYNTFIGRSAGLENTSGSGNTFIGMAAGSSNTYSERNTYVGYRAGSSNYTDDNTFVGYEAGKNSLATQNTAVGSRAGTALMSGQRNTYFGYNAGLDNVEAHDNTFLGTEAGENSEGGDNTFVGSRTGYNNFTGYYNTFIGSSAGYGNSGNQNVFIGERAGSTNDGSNNIFIGFQADGSAGVENATAIGSEASVNASNKVVIGNSSVTTIGGYAPWSNYSDKRLKENIIYKNDLGLEFISRLRTVSYNYKDDKNKRRRDGLIAQDVQQTLEELGLEFSGLIIDDDKMKTMNISYSDLVIPLINAVQELDTENKLLKQEIQDLNALKAEVEAIKQTIYQTAQNR